MSTLGDEVVAQMLLSMYNDFQAVRGTQEGILAVMADQVTELTELQTRMNDFRSDLFARLDALETAQGQFTPEAKVLFDAIKSTLAEADTRVGDADGSDNPPTP